MMHVQKAQSIVFMHRSFLNLVDGDKKVLFCAVDQRRLPGRRGAELPGEGTGPDKGKQGEQNEKAGDVKKPIMMQMVPSRAR